MPTPKNPIACTYCGTLFVRKNGGREKQCRLLCRFWCKVLKSFGCWTWQGGIFTKTGYGQFALTSSKPETAHRMAWILTHGDIPNGLVVRHKCDNRICCNPDHLELGTAQDNVNDKMERGRYVCGIKGRIAPAGERKARSSKMKNAWRNAKLNGRSRPNVHDFATA